MVCPECGQIDNEVGDSRLTWEGRTIRRRRACLLCDHKWTTYEYPAEEIDKLRADSEELARLREMFKRVMAA